MLIGAFSRAYSASSAPPMRAFILSTARAASSPFMSPHSSPITALVRSSGVSPSYTNTLHALISRPPEW